MTSRRSPTALLALALSTLGPLVGACRYDPVPQDIIDALGEEKGTPSAKHRPGQPCLACHSKYEGAEPLMAVAGTLYALDLADNKLLPARNIRVTILDSKGGTRKACTNSAGNFYVAQENWQDITFPILPTAGGTTMKSLIGRDGSCASCHRLPGDESGSLDPLTGAGRDSAGVIVVDANAADPDCGGGQ